MSDSALPAVLAGASGFPHPAVAGFMMFLLAALIGLRLFRELPLATPAARLGLLAILGGAAGLGAVLVSGSSQTMFGKGAGVLACTLATAAAVGGFLITRALLSGDANDTSAS